MQSRLEKISVKYYIFLLTRSCSQSIIRIMDPNTRFPCVTFILLVQNKCSQGRGSQNPFCNVFLMSLEKMQESAMLKILVLRSMSHHLRKLSRFLPLGKLCFSACDRPVYMWKFLCSICRLLNEFRLQDTMGDVQAKAVLPLVK